MTWRWPSFTAGGRAGVAEHFAIIIERIRAKVNQYATAPESLANSVRALKTEPGYHPLRIGTWRVVFSEDSEMIVIIRVAPRGRVYD